MERGKVHQEDPYSFLGESLWSTILSLLPLQEAVATSILSRNWKNAWTWVPHLEIIIDNFMHKLSNWDVYESNEWIKIVDHFLISNEGPIQSCAVETLLTKSSNEDVNHWMDILIQRSIGELTVNHWSEECGYKVPPSIFNCKTIKTLDLRESVLRSCDYVSFNCNNLIRLALHETHIDADTIRRLLRQRTHLKKLILDSCYIEECKDGELLLRIDAPELKSLKITGILKIIHKQVCINAPHLKSLKLGEVIIQKDVKIHAPELEKFESNIKDAKQLEHKHYKGLTCEADRISAILNSISHVKILKLCGFTFKCLFAGNLEIPVFDAKKLSMEADLSERRGAILLSVMLSKCHSLEELKLISIQLKCDDSGWFKNDPSNPEYWEGKQRFNCLRNTLKTVTIEDFKEHDFSFAKFISKGPMMKHLKINYKYMLDSVQIALLNRKKIITCTKKL